MVIGSRGDIQPFQKIGKILQEQHGHRVRIASHPVFRDFVQKENGLDFFSVGGDPAELMASMVKNPGLVLNLSTIREGEIQRRRAAMATMFEGFWRACINTTDDEKDVENLKMMGQKDLFVADAIVANPSSMAHVYVAEKLGIPLHMMFTFPYTPTQQFPHPLANIKTGACVVVMGARSTPNDWGPEIDIAGFVFLDLASNFKPDKELEDFLSAGEPPVYIGFGSIVVDDPDAFTEMIFEAAKKAGVRALANKGWGGLGRSNADTPGHVFMLGNTPHDWLFPRVKAVVHHGCGGTTAIGLKCAKPTMIVPFFGDQPFWGPMVAAARAGAHKCIPYKGIDVEKFAEGIKQCLPDEAQQNVQKIADSIVQEGDGAENAVKSFQRSLPLAGRHNMRCSVLQERVAVWQLKKSSLRLSPLAAELLHEKGKLKSSDLKLLQHYEWNDFDGLGEPITGTVSAVKDGLYGIGGGVGMVPVRIAKHVREREAHERTKQEHQCRKSERRQRKAVPQTNAPTAEGTNTPPRQPQRQRLARAGTSSTLSAVISPGPLEPLAQDLAGDGGSGLKRTGGALISFPNDLHFAIAQGLHNAPRLWGDGTVRKPVRITGFKSGCVAARKVFAYGIGDGWSGLVMQPVGKWRDGESMPGKLVGLVIGLGKGIGGLVLKDVNAIVAPPAYFGKGIVRYVEKKAEGPGSRVFIRRAHIIRGQRELAELGTVDDKDKGQLLRDIKDRVNDGCRVHEEIWNEASQMGRYPFKKEKRSWDVNCALEDVHTANHALAARKDGRDLHKLFAKRKEEMREAERPRASAMEQPDPHGDVLPNGRGTVAVSFTEEQRRPSEEPVPQRECEIQGTDTAQAHGEAARADEDRSETTAVDPSDDDEPKLGDAAKGCVTVLGKHNATAMLGDEEAESRSVSV